MTTLYLIIPVSEVTDQMRKQCDQNPSMRSIRLSLDGSLALLSFTNGKGEKPPLLLEYELIKGAVATYDLEAITKLVSGPDWTPPVKPD